MKNQTFGVIVTTRSFFPAHLVKSAVEKTREAIGKLGYDYVMLGEEDTSMGAVMTYDDAKVCAELFKNNKDKIEGIIVIMPNFGDEAGVADAIKMSGLNVPVLVQACGDELEKLDMSNRRDAFCGKISLCNNLYYMGIPVTNTTTHTCKLDSEIFLNDLNKFAAVCRIVKSLDGLRIGLLGIRPTAFRTVRFSERILQKYGIDVETMDMSYVLERAKSISDRQAIQEKVDEIKAYGKIPVTISTEIVERQARLCLAIEASVEELQCDASAVQCWDSVQNNYGCATCLSMSMMGEKGKPSACESDVMGALTMHVLKTATQTPAAYMDWNNNVNEEEDKCICLHCSNFPKSFFNKDSIEIENLDVLGSTLGAENCFGACKAQVAAGPMTFAKITTDDATGTLKMYVGEGEFLDDHIPTKGGVAMCEIKNLQSHMDYICQNGYEHHVAFVRGHVADILVEALGKYVGISVYRHNGSII